MNPDLTSLCSPTQKSRVNVTEVTIYHHKTRTRIHITSLWNIHFLFLPFWGLFCNKTWNKKMEIMGVMGAIVISGLHRSFKCKMFFSPLCNLTSFSQHRWFICSLFRNSTSYTARLAAPFSYAKSAQNETKTHAFSPVDICFASPAWLDGRYILLRILIVLKTLDLLCMMVRLHRKTHRKINSTHYMIELCLVGQKYIVETYLK